MSHGNPLLHGWVLSDVSFYTTELPQYLLIEMVRGLTPDVVHEAAAMTYTLLVLVTAWLAKGQATGRAAVVRALIPVGIMLAPPLGQVVLDRAGSPAWVVLSAPDHTGTQVPLLLAWLLLDRARRGWPVPVAVTLLLAWVQIADPTALYEGVLPLVLVCGVRMYRRRGSLAGQWYELSLAGGALISAALALAAGTWIRSDGGYFVHSATPAVATASGMAAHFWPKLANLLALFGADFLGLPAAQAMLPLAHLIAVAVVAWAAASAARRFLAHDDLATQVLTVAFFVLFAAFMLNYRTGAREAVGLLPIGAALAGRLLADRVLRTGLVPALTAVLACYTLTLGYALTRPADPGPDPGLAAWLRAHHLSYGLSVTWLASNGITLDSHNHIQVRPIGISADGRLANARWNTKASWYNPRYHDARFVIWDPMYLPSERAIFAAAGRPAATFSVDGFKVFLWHKNLLAARFDVTPARLVPARKPASHARQPTLRHKRR